MSVPPTPEFKGRAFTPGRPIRPPRPSPHVELVIPNEKGRGGRSARREPGRIRFRTDNPLAQTLGKLEKLIREKQALYHSLSEADPYRKRLGSAIQQLTIRAFRVDQYLGGGVFEDW